MKVALYTRVSLDKEEQKTSLKTQEEYYIDYCEKYNYELIKIYADEGLSGTKLKRDSFLEMLEDAGLDITINDKGKVFIDTSRRKPKFNLIITKDVSRFARTVQAIEVVKALRTKKVYVLFENNNIDSRDDNYEFILNLFLNFAQQESKDRSKKVALAYRNRARNEKFHMSVVLYGYQYNKETNSYEIDETEAEIVKQMYNMYIKKNMGCRLISDYLNENGIKTKKGRDWRPTAVKRTIENEKYKGLVILGRQTKEDITTNNRVIERDPSEWVFLENALPAIVTPEEWAKAQEIMAGRVVKSHENTLTGLRQSENIFYQKIRCSKCITDFVRVSGTKTRGGQRVVEQTYYCRNRRLFKKCDMRGISHKVLEREIMKLANGDLENYLTNSIEDERYAAEQVLNTLEQRKKESVNHKDKLKSQIDKISEQKDKLFMSFLEGDSSPTMKKIVQEKMESLEEEKKTLERQSIQYDIIEIEKSEEFVKNKLNEIERFSRKKKFTFDDVLEMINFIAVYPDRKLKFMLKRPTLVASYFKPENFDINEDHDMGYSIEVTY